MTCANGKAWCPAAASSGITDHTGGLDKRQVGASKATQA